MWFCIIILWISNIFYCIKTSEVKLYSYLLALIIPMAIPIWISVSHFPSVSNLILLLWSPLVLYCWQKSQHLWSVWASPLGFKLLNFLSALYGKVLQESVTVLKAKKERKKETALAASHGLITQCEFNKNTEDLKLVLRDSRISLMLAMRNSIYWTYNKQTHP